jgi:uncharacterized protein with von Willebrand factor type A (vWA) domain
MDIMVLADMSGSVGNYEGHVSNAIDVFVDKFDLDDQGVRIGIITFSMVSAIHIQQPLTSSTSLLKKNIIAISNMKAAGGTVMSSPLVEVMKELQKDRFSVYKVVIIISDGDIQRKSGNPIMGEMSDDRASTSQIAELMKAHNIIICGILIDEGWGGTDGPYLKSLTTPGLYTESNYKNLATTLQKLAICI